MNDDERAIRDPRGRRHKRGYLPHFDALGFTQFVTFRLADSLPVKLFEKLKFELELRQITEIEYHRKIERALDIGDGPTYLKDPKIASMVAETLLKFDGQKYTMHAWVIMPNHVHLLFSPSDNFSLSEIMHSIKSFTAKKANEILSRSGRFWSPDYFDRFIRDRDHFTNAKKYIENNPVKAGLCEAPEEWWWGSAGFSG